MNKIQKLGITIGVVAVWYADLYKLSLYSSLVAMTHAGFGRYISKVASLHVSRP